MRVLRLLNRTLSHFEIETHRLAVNGPVVLTERTDVVVIGPLRIGFWVCGTFEVHDRRITLWRDYFDWAAIPRNGNRHGPGDAVAHHKAFGLNVMTPFLDG